MEVPEILREKNYIIFLAMAEIRKFVGCNASLSVIKVTFLCFRIREYSKMGIIL